MSSKVGGIARAPVWGANPFIIIIIIIKGEVKVKIKISPVVVFGVPSQMVLVRGS